MNWWLAQPSRARTERAAIADLEERSPWLRDVIWKPDLEHGLAVEFEIRHFDEAFRLKLIYPTFFPATVPQILPREAIRLSDHQWGEGGELCLQLRADNWDPTFTGAMMVESAYALLSGERPAAEERAEVPSAHRISQAQSIRGEKWRFLLPEEAGRVLRTIAYGTAVELTLSEHGYAGHWLIQPVRLGPAASPLWQDAVRVPDGKAREGFAVRLPEGKALPGGLDQAKLDALLGEIGLDAVAEAMNAAPGEIYLVLVGKKVTRLFLSYPAKGGRTLATYTCVDMPSYRQRLSDEYGVLTGKRVGIIGCGSMGSKVAAMLARSGVGAFVLIDGDILNADNLVRNELDGYAVGMHKVDGLTTKLEAINPGVAIATWRIKLGGQESASLTDTALSRLAECDILVDATADATVFNLCAWVARSERKPMVWGEVLAGGIGGLVGRCRPDIEPPPHEARRQLNDWCAVQDEPWEGREALNYELPIDGAPPLIAGDADVSIIAGHVVKLVIDALMDHAQSAFSSPAYAIGLAKAWIFAGPFDVAPIDFSPEGKWGLEWDEDAAEQLTALIGELFPDSGTGPDAD